MLKRTPRETRDAGKKNIWCKEFVRESSSMSSSSMTFVGRMFSLQDVEVVRRNRHKTTGRGSRNRMNENERISLRKKTLTLLPK